jgi:RNase adaptor protein for sRNA GlmZ degradation
LTFFKNQLSRNYEILKETLRGENNDEKFTNYITLIHETADEVIAKRMKSHRKKWSKGSNDKIKEEVEDEKAYQSPLEKQAELINKGSGC